MARAQELPGGVRLVSGNGDATLDRQLSAGLYAHNIPAAAAGPQREAERVALARGYQRSNVSSFTFQAPEFYAKHGYAEVSRTEDLPLAGQADVHFVKHLQ